jgi:DNA modification methylase
MSDWPADSVERRKVSSLVPYARNSRTHSDEQVAQIAASIKEWGWTTPVLIDAEGGIIAGHGRILAAQKLGIPEVPCMVADGWTEAQKRAYVIADNKLALNAGWDNDMLKVELGELSDLDFDLSLVGFNDDELGTILADKTEGLTDPDDIPELQEAAVTMRGDIWLLGNHRLRCGDSTDADDVGALLGDVKPHLMVTDPPYGVNYDPSWRDKVDGVWTSSRSTGLVQNDDKADWTEAWALFPGHIAYVWHGGLHSAEVQESLEQAGFAMRAQIIWVKQHFVFSRGDCHWQHEPCWYAVKGKGQWAGDRKQSTIWEIANASAMGGKKDDGLSGHGTQKPVECMRRPIVNNSSPGQAVYEPFCGSGTTIIAGEMEGRHIYAMELDERYCDVIVKRWQDFTGQDAIMEGEGKTFNEIAEQRYGEAA